MEKKLNYIILEEEALVLEYYSGQFNAEELIDFKQRIGFDSKYDPTFDVLSDIRDSKLLFNFDEVKKYVKFLFDNKKHLGQRKTVMITKTPNQVVAALAYDMQKENLPVIYKVCSSCEAAYTFLGVSAQVIDKVNSMMMKLTNKSDVCK